MFHQSEIQHDSMILNVATNIFAFFTGLILSLTSEYHSFSSFSTDLLTIVTLSDTLLDTLSFLMKSIISGFIALAVKVSGDLIINYFKERRAKGNGKH